MLLRGRSAAHIACRAGLFVVFVDELQVVRLRLDQHMIEIGRDAPRLQVIECAYRYALSRLGAVDERELARLVAQHEWSPYSASLLN